MTTVREYIYEPDTNNRVDNRTPFEDSEAADLFLEPLIVQYDNSSEWTFKNEVDGVRTYTNNSNNSICELSNN